MEHQGFVWSFTNLVYSGRGIVTSWPSPSLGQPWCIPVSVFALCALAKQVPHLWPCPPITSFLLSHLVRQDTETDGFMAHHFHYGYLLLPCCVGETNAARFRLQTPAKPSRAARGSLSQQHPASRVGIAGVSSPAAYCCVAPQPCSWTHGLQMCHPSSECSCCICTCWAGSRGGAGDRC